MKAHTCQQTVSHVWAYAIAASIAIHAIALWCLNASPRGSESIQETPSALRLNADLVLRRAAVATTALAETTTGSDNLRERPSARPHDTSPMMESEQLAQRDPHFHAVTQEYLPSAALDRPPLPISAPDPRRFLTGLELASSPVRLRIFIENTGTVSEVSAISSESLAVDIQPLREMFVATLFIPGKLKGQDVASYIDLEIQANPATELAANPD